MAGRRLNTRSEVEQWLADALMMVSEIDPPAGLEAWCFTACYNGVRQPSPMRDLDQAKQDIREALEIAAWLDVAGPPLLLVVANAALEAVSAREHVIAMPGMNREQRRHGQ